jgi:hypothetical protein
MRYTKHEPLRACLYCNRRHRTWTAIYACQDRYERNYDEMEVMLREDPRSDPMIQETIFQIMQGHIDRLDHYAEIEA